MNIEQMRYIFFFLVRDQMTSGRHINFKKTNKVSVNYLQPQCGYS